MEEKMKNEHPYMRMIAGRVPIIFDGALGTEIQKAGPSKEDFGGYEGCGEYLNISRPEIIEAIHVSYLEAGARAIETNTFGGSRSKLNEFGLGDRVYEINRAAAATARRAIDRVTGNRGAGGSDWPRFVCGSIGPTGFLPSSSDRELSAIDFDRLADIYREQAAGLLDGGADLLLIETSQDLLEVRAAIKGIRELTKTMDRYVPLQVQVTMDGGGKMLLGSDVEAFLGAVQGMGVDVVGLNCSSGPDEMAPWIDELLELSTLPISMLPNAGLPCNVDGKAVYKMGAEEFAEKVGKFVSEKGVAVVGGCCGTTPEHIGALARRLGNAERAYPGANRWDVRSCWLSTGISGADLERAKRPVIIGERLNAQGSKKAKEYIIGGNYDELYHIAMEQVERGSDLIDICVAANELDISEAEAMGNVVRFLRDRIAAPFCIDTTEPAVLEAALKRSPGAVLVNSINLEHGGEKAKRVLSLAAGFGCPVVALTIDDAGMAATADRKFEVACRLRKLACDEYGLPEHYVYIDPLVFTLATGEADTAGAALESLEALRRIKKEFPGMRAAMGVSNVSFGLKPKARRVLNNLMLRHAVEAGLDAAIFNPLHVDDVDGYEPTVRELAEDLLLNRRPDSLLRFAEYFEVNGNNVNADGNVITGNNDIPKSNITNRYITNSNIPKSNIAGNAAILSPEDRLRGAVIGRDRRDLPDIIGKLLETRAASDILNTVLLPAMSEVGDRMASGEMILPFVLQAAEVMKEAVSILEPRLKDGDGAVKGKIVIATVYGDVHDIGKNLVASILRNQGFEVVDLGKQVHVDAIVESVRREKPDVLGLSALLVTTSQEMGKCVKEFAKLGIDTPIVIGGAAVNRDFAARISILDDGNRYAAGVHYAKDAFDVVRIFDGMRAERSADRGDLSIDKRASSAESTPRQRSAPLKKRPKLKYDYFIEPPFYGTGEVLTWDAGSLLSSIDREHLFKAWWGGGKLAADDYESARREEFEPVLERLAAEAVSGSLIDARAFYGFFPAISDGEKIIILDPSDHRAERLSFVFPRSERSGLSLADYVRPEGDVISAQAVTIGGKLGDCCREYLLNRDRYSDGYYLNGLGGFLTEALARKVSGEIRRAAGIPKDAGRRYSFGYSGMPGLEEQARLIEFLGVEERLGITLTEGFQMRPEHSTVAVFVFHPDADYL